MKGSSQIQYLKFRLQRPKETVPEMMINKKVLQFLKELSNNNNRVRFQANKEWFNEIQNEMIAITGYFLTEIEKFDKSVKGLDPKQCIFRIYKDVRFSKDKSPYKTHLGIFMRGGDKKIEGTGYYLHIEPQNSLLGGGCYQPDPKSFQNIRESIVNDAKSFKKIIHSQSFKKDFGTEFYAEKLKTAPKGFEKVFSLLFTKHSVDSLHSRYSNHFYFTSLSTHWQKSEI